VQPRILLIDEALAVGDKAFRSKSAARIDEIVSGAGTLMLVSHSMDEIKRMCERVLWVEQGELIADGPTDDVLAEYAKT
jgi:ABC-type polysaccharide/polyol phosphate transport system ATPase subunit